MNSPTIASRWLRRYLDRRREWRCVHLGQEMRASARQERIRGWDQRRLSMATILQIGAGGLGGEMVEGFAQKGAGTVVVADGDFVSPTDLNRQRFTPVDLWRSKAVRLCANASRRGFLGTRLVAKPCMYQDLDLMAERPDLVVAAVDNQIPSTREEVCRFAHARGIPALILGATPDADGGYVFVQEGGRACWCCAFKPDLQAAASREARCPESPASTDILRILAGIALYAADSILMSRPREWNLWTVSLRRAEFGGPILVPPRADCPLCGGGRSS